MKELPHRYTASAMSAADAATVTLESPGLERIDSAGPVEFDGPGDLWSPETLLPAIVGDCFVLTFKAVADASRFAWLDLRVEVEAAVDKVERVIRFTEFQLHATLTIAADADEERARRVLDKAERACLVRNSLAAPVHPTFSVVRG